MLLSHSNRARRPCLDDMPKKVKIIYKNAVHLADIIAFMGPIVTSPLLKDHKQRSYI